MLHCRARYQRTRRTRQCASHSGADISPARPPHLPPRCAARGAGRQTLLLLLLPRAPTCSRGCSSPDRGARGKVLGSRMRAWQDCMPRPPLARWPHPCQRGAAPCPETLIAPNIPTLWPPLGVTVPAQPPRPTCSWPCTTRTPTLRSLIQDPTAGRCEPSMDRSPWTTTGSAVPSSGTSPSGSDSCASPCKQMAEAVVGSCTLASLLCHAQGTEPTLAGSCRPCSVSRSRRLVRSTRPQRYRGRGPECKHERMHDSPCRAASWYAPPAGGPAARALGCAAAAPAPAPPRRTCGCHTCSTACTAPGA